MSNSDKSLRDVFKIINGEKIKIAFEDLTVGDIFCLEEDGKPVRMKNGCEMFEATNLPFQLESGIWAIDCDSYFEKEQKNE